MAWTDLTGVLLYQCTVIDSSVLRTQSHLGYHCKQHVTPSPLFTAKYQKLQLFLKLLTRLQCIAKQQTQPLTDLKIRNHISLLIKKSRT